MANPSHVCNLHHSSWQHWILNPLSKARDQTHILMVTNQVHIPLSHNQNPLMVILDIPGIAVNEALAVLSSEHRIGYNGLVCKWFGGFFGFGFCLFFWLHLQHVEVLGKVLNLSCRYQPIPHPQQRGIQATCATYATACGNTGFFNPLSEARD